MKAEREWFDPAKRSILAKTSPDSVIDVFSFILLVCYPRRTYAGGLFMIPGMATTAKKAPLPRSFESSLSEIALHSNSADSRQWPSIRSSYTVLLREDFKTDPSVKAIDREIAAVHCEDPPDAFSLSHSDKCSVREIHRAVGILDHELSYAGYVY
jgi:hypothetical protein